MLCAELSLDGPYGGVKTVVVTTFAIPKAQRTFVTTHFRRGRDRGSVRDLALRDHLCLCRPERR